MGGVFESGNSGDTRVSWYLVGHHDRHDSLGGNMCNCTNTTNLAWHDKFGESDGYGSGVRADRMRARDAYADAIEALSQAHHYLIEHSGVVESDMEAENISSLLTRMIEAVRVKSDDHSQRLL